MRWYAWLGCVVAAGALGALAYAQEGPDAQQEDPVVIDLSAYDPEQRRIAQAMVDQAIAAFALDVDSTVAAIADADSLLYRDGDLFVIVADQDMAVAAHGNSPGAVGNSLHNLTDPADSHIAEVWDSVWNPYGKWAEYEYVDPDAGESEKRLVWAKTRSGYLFAVGMSPGIQPMDLECEFTIDAPHRQLFAQNVVDRAIVDFGIDPPSTLKAVINQSDATYADTELFVIDSDMVIQAHRTLPGAVGFDMSESPIGQLIQNNSSPYGKWVQYDLGADVGKRHTWVKYDSGYTFGVMTACG